MTSLILRVLDKTVSICHRNGSTSLEGIGFCSGRSLAGDTPFWLMTGKRDTDHYTNTSLSSEGKIF